MIHEDSMQVNLHTFTKTLQPKKKKKKEKKEKFRCYQDKKKTLLKTLDSNVLDEPLKQGRIAAVSGSHRRQSKHTPYSYS